MNYQACLCLALLTSPVAAQQRLYACNWTGDLVEIVDYDAVPTLRWVPRDPNLIVFQGHDIAIHATSGMLFFHTTGTLADTYEVDPIAGGVISVSGCFATNTCGGLDSDSHGQLYSVGPNWAAAGNMRILSTGFSLYCLEDQGPHTVTSYGGDLAIDVDGSFVSTVHGSTQLVRIDPSSGAATPFADPGVAFLGLEVDTDGALYGLVNDGRLYRIDRTTSAISLLTTLPYVPGGAAGNWSGLAFRLPAERLDSEVICSAMRNSTGGPATLSPRALAAPPPGLVEFLVEGMPSNGLTLLLVSPTSTSVSVGAGNLCLGTPVRRVYPPVLSDASGRARLPLDLGAVPGHGPVSSGDRLYFQAWFRDTAPPAQATVNFSDGLQVDFL